MEISWGMVQFGDWPSQLVLQLLLCKLLHVHLEAISKPRMPECVCDEYLLDCLCEGRLAVVHQQLQLLLVLTFT